MSSLVFLDRHKLALAMSEVEVINKRLPESTVASLAQEVVQRVASRLCVEQPLELRPTEDQIDGLCHALLSRDQMAAISLIEASQSSGVSYEAVCQFYLAAASRRLGEWWTQDRVSFYQVTIAAGRIYAILRILRLQKPAPIADIERSGVFVSVPGDDHTLGITMAADLARQRGWDIELFVGRSHDDLVLELEQRNPYLIGISASTQRAIPGLTKLIVAMRVTNPASKILICGNIVAHDLNLMGIVGADAAETEFDAAFAYMEHSLTCDRNERQH